jgi:hypothetical protein
VPRGDRFGFNVARSMVDGLGGGGPDVTADFSTIAYQLKCVRVVLCRSCRICEGALVSACVLT